MNAKIQLFKSTFIGLIASNKFEHVLTPWKVQINIETGYVIISKRNWYLIGIDVEQHKINHIRFVKVNNNIFGSDIHVKVFANSFSIYGFNNSDAQKIRQLITKNR